MMRLFFALILFMGNFCTAQDSIKPADVHRAANLLDLKYSDKEVEMMMPVKQVETIPARPRSLGMKSLRRRRRRRRRTKRPAP
jgi:hypothetical protein